MKKLLLIKLLFFATLGLFANNDSIKFVPSGKAFGKVYSNFHTGTNLQSNNNAFEITRAYLGYKYKMTQNWSAKVNIDIGNPKVGEFEMTAFLKDASLTFQKKRFTFRFGMISMQQFKAQERHWGYRYILKSFQDEFKFASSADIGSFAKYEINDFISVDVTASNGEGYKQVQSDKTYRGGLGFTVSPAKSFIFRYYFDYMEKSEAQTTHALFMGYRFKDKFSIGAEYNLRENHEYKQNNNIEGYSIYATYHINDKLNVFGRFDKLASKRTGSIYLLQNIDGDYYTAGVEYKPTKGINISINHRYFSDLFGSNWDNSYAYFNFEYAF